MLGITRRGGLPNPAGRLLENSNAELQHGGETMRVFARRMQRLEKRLALAVATGETRDSPAAQLRARRRARGVPDPPSDQAGFKGATSLTQILRSGRERATAGRIAAPEQTADLAKSPGKY